MLIVVVTGLLLQVKKEFAWIQPPTERGVSIENRSPLSLDKLLDIVREVPEAQVAQWSDIDRFDIRPSKGVAKVRCTNRWEVQIDLSTGELLASNYRRSDLIESLHDGSFFTDWCKLGVFLPNGFVLLGLLLSGIWLWYLPIKSWRNKRRRVAQGSDGR